MVGIIGVAEGAVVGVADGTAVAVLVGGPVVAVGLAVAVAAILVGVGVGAGVPEPAAHATAVSNNVQPSVVKSKAAVGSRKKPTRRAGAIPVTIAAPVS
ncbi:hypothetical protein Hgul01_05140 [Herpetosiphon gulosus]|uniref:Uncharacterized protein n=1 Tax=Herpetosiphon gulosus TaxID=1973496 RepID=A0ABP9X7F1_9CHLR